MHYFTHKWRSGILWIIVVFSLRGPPSQLLPLLRVEAGFITQRLKPSQMAKYRGGSEQFFVRLLNLTLNLTFSHILCQRGAWLIIPCYSAVSHVRKHFWCAFYRPQFYSNTFLFTFAGLVSGWLLISVSHFHGIESSSFPTCPKSNLFRIFCFHSSWPNFWMPFELVQNYWKVVIFVCLRLTTVVLCERLPVTIWFINQFASSPIDLLKLMFRTGIFFQRARDRRAKLFNPARGGVIF